MGPRFRFLLVGNTIGPIEGAYLRFHMLLVKTRLTVRGRRLCLLAVFQGSCKQLVGGSVRAKFATHGTHAGITLR
jgi:hypothetical protein